MSCIELVLEVVLSAFGGGMLYKYCSLFMPRYQGKRRLLIGYLIYYMINIIFTLIYQETVIRAFLVMRSLCSIFVVPYIIFCSSIYKKILLAILYCVINMGVKILTLVILMCVGVRTDEYLYPNRLFVNLTVFIVVLFIYIYYDWKYAIENQLRHHIVMMFIPIGSIFIIDRVFREITNSATSVSISIVLILFNMILFVVYTCMNEQVEQQQYNMQYKQQVVIWKSHIEEIGLQMREQRRIMHDIKHQNMFLQTLMEMDSITKIKGYIREVLEENFIDSLDVFRTGNIIIDSLLNYKCAIANAYEIQVTHMIRIPDVVEISESDLFIIIGNAFDNAIEACEYLEESRRKIDLVMQYDKNNLFIELKNSYNENFSVMKKEKWITNKANKEYHGIGISSMERLVNRYNGYMNIEAKEGEFKLSILLCEPENKE